MDIKKATDEYEKIGTDVPEFSLLGNNLYVRVVDVYDGDTLTVIIPVGGKYYRYHVRMIGIDTCEMKSRNQLIKTRAIRARNTILKWICDPVCPDRINVTERYSSKDIPLILSERVYLVWIKCGNFEKFGRLLAAIYNNSEDEESFASRLIQCRLGYAYNGGSKISEDDQLLAVSL